MSAKKLSNPGYIQPSNWNGMNLYLAGPMTGYEDWNYPTFNAAAELLRRERYAVYNPATTGVIDGVTHAKYLRYNTKWMMDADIVALLPGWHLSKGATFEAFVALACGIEVKRLDREYEFHCKTTLTDVIPHFIKAWAGDDSTQAPAVVPATLRTVLEEANHVSTGDRQTHYGNPRDNHGCAGDLWRAWVKRRHNVDVPFTPRDVCWMNILQKASRDANLPKRDNLVDVCGYARNAEMIEETQHASNL